MELQQEKTAIFWDYENVPFSSGDLTNFLNDIEEIKKNIDKSSFLKCFGDWKRVPEAIQTEIQQAGFELIQVPQTRKNAADSVLTVNAINVYHQSNYQNFYLISADGDFSALLMDLKNKGIKICIIARKKNISKDLSQYCSEFYYLTSKGNLFKYEVKKREDILELLESSMEDAQTAFKGLLKKTLEKGIQIFPFKEWEKSYLAMENYKLTPIILNQLITLKDLFKIFVRFYGYGHDINYDNICIHSSEKRKNINELEIEFQIPNAKKIRTPIREIPKANLKDLISEFTSNDKEANYITTETGKETILPVESTTPSLDVMTYLSTVAMCFRQMVQNKKSPGEIKLTNLNTKVCEALSINTSSKLYKNFEFKTFSIAVEAAKSQFGRKISIEKDSIKF
ncbi:MAG: NYN domain-containing protein [Promethearchaeota archaeon]